MYINSIYHRDMYNDGLLQKSINFVIYLLAVIPYMAENRLSANQHYIKRVNELLTVN